ncbi:MAG: insulinase family protein [Bacilli bacterium]|nr:insulinase family protein [Bacilli bacterium]
MNIGEIKYGFKLLRSRKVEDLNATLHEFEHIKSGGLLAYVEADDTNCVMAIGFRTLPEDSTGVCHIIEHSTLCGSKKYPLKEPFVNLLKNSLATFLNAFTAYDWTMYPCASQTPKDFDNIMDVYLDAVFNPKSMNDERPFLQEGWHLELTDKDALPCYKGVVYNEMKGAMSSVGEVLTQTTLEAMYPDTAYRFNSGGEPDDIPNLTYDAYKAFYKAHYNPQNAMTVLYGKMDIEAKLKYIDEEYFSKYDKGEALTIPMQKPIINLDYKKEYEIGPDEEIKDNTYMALAYALCEYNDMESMMAWRIIDDALLSDNGSPLKKALLDRKLGQDISARIDDDNINPALYINLEKTNPNKKEEFKAAFEEEVKKIVENGIDKELLIASINNLEFKDKESDMGGFPKGIAFAMSMMGSFNYNGDLLSHLEFSKYYKKFREELNNGYFEKLLENAILNSKHHVEVMITPSKTLGEEKKAKMDALMKAKKEAMTPEEIDALVKQTKELIAYQSHVDTPKELKCLPELKLTDIPLTVNGLNTKKTKIKGYNAITHVAETQGIAYVNAYFDLSSVPAEDLIYVSLLTSLYRSVPTSHYDLTQLSNVCKTYLGDLGFGVQYLSTSKNEAKAFATISASALKENVDKIPELINEIIFHSKFDSKVVKQTLDQTVNSLRMGIIGNGMGVAIAEASSEHSASASLSAQSGGPRAYAKLQDIVNNYNISELKAKFKELIAKIYCKNKVLISITGEEDVVASAKVAMKALKLKKGPEDAVLVPGKEGTSKKALIIPAPINYNAIAANINDFGYEFSGICPLICHIMRYNYLWDEVRVKGGAYGCSISMTKNGVVAFGSYRDPNVVNTYDTFKKAGEYLESFAPTKSEFKNYVIGALGGFDKPVSVRILATQEDLSYIVGSTKKDKMKTKKELLHAKVGDVKAWAPLFKQIATKSTEYTVGSKAKIDEYKFDEVNSL